jgi:hypothetical protein
LFHNTLALNLPADQGPGTTKGDFIFPYARFPYLTHILGLHDIDLCGPDLEEVVDQAVRREQRDSSLAGGTQCVDRIRNR